MIVSVGVRLSQAPFAAETALGRALRLFAAGVLALLTLGLGLCLVAHGAAVFAVGTNAVPGQELLIQRGSGEVTDNGLLVRAPAASDTVLVLTPRIDAPARQNNLVRWSVIGLRDDHELQVVWTTDRAPGRAIAYNLSARERERGQADLTDKRGWEGRIGRIGLMLRGPLPEPVLISSVALESARGACVAAWEGWIGAWMHREPWSQRSINFYIGYERGSTHLTPVLSIALWVLLAGGFYWLLCRRCGHVARLTGVSVLVLTGWLAVDLRWQAQLWERLGDSQQRYAGLTQHERRLAAPDAKLTKLVDRLRAHLPDQPARVLILSDDPSGFIAGRMRYHLAPHRVYVGLSQLPAATQVAPGDYLFVIRSLRSVRLARGNRLLTDNGRSLAVEPVTSIRGLGALYRVRGDA